MPLTVWRRRIRSLARRDWRNRTTGREFYSTFQRTREDDVGSVGVLTVHRGWHSPRRSYFGFPSVLGQTQGEKQKLMRNRLGTECGVAWSRYHHSWRANSSAFCIW